MAEKMTLARPYAKAIFELAKENKQYEAWSKNLKNLSLITQNSSVEHLLGDRYVSEASEVDFVFSVCGESLDDYAKNLVRLLAKNHRLSVLPEIAFLYEKLRSEAENTLEVELLTPVPVTEKEAENFKKRLEKILSKTIKLVCQSDSTLLGGFVARAGHYVIDGSLKSRVINLKNAMGG